MYTAKDSEFHRITCFNGLGQNVAKFCSKGQLVTAEGRIHYTQWEDQDGTKRYLVIDEGDYSPAHQTSSIAACAGIVSPACGTVTGGQFIAAQVLFDLAYQAQLGWDTTLTVAVANLLDRDPSFARLEYSYDPFTGNPIGRAFRIGIKKSF